MELLINDSELIQCNRTIWLVGCTHLSHELKRKQQCSGGSKNTNHTWCITHVDSSGSKILSLCLSLGQWKSLIRPWPANERRRVDGPGEERRRGRQFLEMITDSFPCLSCLWKEKERPPHTHTPTPSPPPHRSPTHCITTTEPLHHHHHQQHPSKALIGPSLITLAPYSFTFAPVLWQICFTLSINNFLLSSILSLNFSFCPSFLRSALLWNWGSHL